MSITRFIKDTFAKIGLTDEEENELKKIEKDAYMQEARTQMRIKGLEKARQEFGKTK